MSTAITLTVTPSATYPSLPEDASKYKLLSPSPSSALTVGIKIKDAGAASDPPCHIIDIWSGAVLLKSFDTGS